MWYESDVSLFSVKFLFCDKRYSGNDWFALCWMPNKLGSAHQVCIRISYVCDYCWIVYHYHVWIKLCYVNANDYLFIWRFFQMNFVRIMWWWNWRKYGPFMSEMKWKFFIQDFILLIRHHAFHQTKDLFITAAAYEIVNVKRGRIHGSFKLIYENMANIQMNLNGHWWMSLI